ncbi:MAG: hypothetical protein JW854_06000 [Actinobacteria bacterium]|nr:hypothetical protein [Actinomycetota bacterium]
MQGVNMCPECGVPEYITSEHLWQESGFIVQKRDQRHILTFIENDNLNALFLGVEDILGTSIERIILATRRRTGRAYMDRIIPKQVKELVQRRELELPPMVTTFFSIGSVLGYGRFELVDYRYQQDDDDYFVIRVEKPYSMLLGSVDPAAAVEALIGAEMGFTYEEISPEVYDIRVFKEEHEEEYKGRLMMKHYQSGGGDVALRSCSTCGGPHALSYYDWDLERGLINNKFNGRRMVFFAPSVLDAVFGELERELGESIPDIVIEAQRRFARNFYNPADVVDEDRFRTALALRGMGNLRRLSIDRGGLDLLLGNAVMHLLVVGLFQGFYEIAHGVESTVEWSISESGDLEVQVSPSRL